MSKLLITGGAGFIGSNFARRQVLNSKYTKVTVLDSLTYAGNLKNLAPIMDLNNFNFIKCDIRDQEKIKSVISDHDIVVHFAAESHVDRSIANPNTFIQTNVLGTFILLEAARDSSIETFIHVSTDEVYGSIQSGSWNEESTIDPNSPYSASKASSDLIALSYFKTFGLDVRITRSSNNYGPYQYPEKLIPLFITNLMDNIKVPIYGKGENIRDWIHVDDNCLGIEKVIEHGSAGEIYNLGGGNELTNLKISEKILNAFGFDDSMISYVEDRKGHDLRYSVKSEKAKSKLGFNPIINLNTGLQETIDWYKNNRSWWEPLKSLKT